MSTGEYLNYLNHLHYLAGIKLNALIKFIDQISVKQF